MRVQDVIFSAGSISFAAALIPMLVGKTKPPLSSSVLTAGWLWAFALCYLTLGLRYSAATGAVTAACWSVLAVQRWRQRT